MVGDKGDHPQLPIAEQLRMVDCYPLDGTLWLLLLITSWASWLNGSDLLYCLALDA